MGMTLRNLGRVVEGHVLDCNKKYLERKLVDYDSQLYLKWNPKKNEGNGLWELRRRPNSKVPVPKTEFNGHIYYELEYEENDMIHHVLDLHVLNYKVLTKLKSIDAWENRNYIADRDNLAEAKLIEQENKYSQTVRELAKEHRREFRELQEHVRSGLNPFSFFNGRHKK